MTDQTQTIEIDERPAPAPPEDAALVAREHKAMVFDPTLAAQELEYRVTAIARVRREALNMIYPRDFVVHGDGDDAQCYLQNIGAQRTIGLLGAYEVMPGPQHERVDEDNGEFRYEVTGFMGSRSLGVVIYEIGTRSSSSDFFTKRDGDGNRRPVAPDLVLKSALSNWRNRALSGLAGLRGLTVSALRDLKFPIEKSGRVAYKGGAKGGGADVDVCPLGKNKGKKWSEIKPNEIKWAIGIFEKDLKDASKAKWHDKTKRQIEAAQNALEQIAQAEAK